MFHYDEECLKTFLEKQTQLLKEPVAETLEEADEFLDDCLAIVLDSTKEIKEYWDENGIDVTGMTLQEIEDSLEVFKLPSGKYLVVEA